MNSQAFSQYIIRPVLAQLGCCSLNAEALLLTIGHIESDLELVPNDLTQDRHGIFQISSDMHKTAWDLELVRTPDTASIVRGLASQHNFLNNPDHELVCNLTYATAITWYFFNHHLPKSIQQCTPKTLAATWSLSFHQIRNPLAEQRFIILYESHLKQMTQAA